MNIRLAKIGPVAGALFLCTALLSAPAHAQLRQIECAASGAGDISMSADYRERFRNNQLRRRKFSVEFEAAPRGQFNLGDRLAVIVAGVRVARPELRQDINGDLFFDVNFDTFARQNDATAFPPNFPTIGQRARVAIRKAGQLVLACMMR